MIGFLTENIWETITRCVKKRQQNFVAVAYFGRGGADLLPLKKGDILVVDASKNQIEAGLVDPGELLKLVKEGVMVFSYPHLHAKVYVLGNKLFVGSSNVSQNSSKNLKEAVIETNDPKMVKNAKKWITDLANSPLLEKNLVSLLKYYKPPKKVFRSTEIEYLLYLVNIDFNSNFSNGFEEPLNKGQERLDKLFPSISRKEYDYFEYPNSPDFVVGDFLLIRSRNAKGEAMVNKPCRVLHIQPWELDEKHFVFYSKPKGKRQQLLKLGLSLRKRDGFLSPDKSKEIMRLWNLNFNEL